MNKEYYTIAYGQVIWMGQYMADINGGELARYYNLDDAISHMHNNEEYDDWVFEVGVYKVKEYGISSKAEKISPETIWSV